LFSVLLLFLFFVVVSVLVLFLFFVVVSVFCCCFCFLLFLFFCVFVVVVLWGSMIRRITFRRLTDAERPKIPVVRDMDWWFSQGKRLKYVPCKRDGMPFTRVMVPMARLCPGDMVRLTPQAVDAARFLELPGANTEMYLDDWVYVGAEPQPTRALLRRYPADTFSWTVGLHCIEPPESEA
jgi:hypothetical protein